MTARRRTFVVIAMFVLIAAGERAARADGVCTLRPAIAAFR